MLVRVATKNLATSLQSLWCRASLSQGRRSLISLVGRSAATFHPIDSTSRERTSFVFPSVFADRPPRRLFSSSTAPLLSTPGAFVQPESPPPVDLSKDKEYVSSIFMEQLRPYQRECVERSLDCWKQGES